MDITSEDECCMLSNLRNPNRDFFWNARIEKFKSCWRNSDSSFRKDSKLR
jgi:hypothetical protein